MKFTDKQKTNTCIAALIALLVALSVIRPLLNPDEGRYGAVGWWMLQSGDWITPRLNGLPFFHKPPLVYWLEGLSIAAFGAHPWSIRLVPVLHASALLLVICMSLRLWTTEHLSRRASIVFGTSLAFLGGGQFFNHDMAVATWISIAILSFGAALNLQGKRAVRWALLGFVACALGVMSKGLIGLVLPGMVLFIWIFWTGKWWELVALPWLRGGCIFFAITLPWFWYEAIHYPNFLNYFFVIQHFSRFTGASFNNKQPGWFYFACIFFLLFLWALFAALQGRLQLQKKHAYANSVERDWVSLCWIWFWGILIFFSTPNSKLIGYALPMIPPLAILAAFGFENIFPPKSQSAAKLFSTVAWVNVGIAIALTIFFALLPQQRKHSRDVAATLACLSAAQDEVYVAFDYPADLAFYAQLKKPVHMIENWEFFMGEETDGWQQAMLDGLRFEPSAMPLFHTKTTLKVAAQKEGSWLLVPSRVDTRKSPSGWQLVQTGVAWNLYQSSPASKTKSPIATQEVSLDRCKH